MFRAKLLNLAEIRRPAEIVIFLKLKMVNIWRENRIDFLVGPRREFVDDPLGLSSFSSILRFYHLLPR